MLCSRQIEESTTPDSRLLERHQSKCLMISTIESVIALGIRQGKMKILSAVFTDSDSKLTVMFENEGQLESGIYPISRVEVEKYERVDFPTEIAGKKIAFTATKA